MVRVVCQLFTTTSQTTKTILLPSVLLYSVTFFVPSYHQLRLVNVFLRALVILQVSYSLYWLLYVVLIPTNFYFLGSGPEGFDDLCFHTYGEFSPPPPSPSSSSPSPPPIQILL